MSILIFFEPLVCVKLSIDWQLKTYARQTDGLKQDAQVWSVGILPFYEYSATALKVSSLKAANILKHLLQTTLLKLLQEHFIKLGPDLRPMARAFILALLPGIEEESSEHFEEVSGSRK